jgi:CBS domain-containing protein
MTEEHKYDGNLMRDPIRAMEPPLPVCVPPTATVDDVLNLLVARKIGCVLVTEKGHVLGIFSERDALMRINVDVEKFRQDPISKYMTVNPDSLDMDDKIAMAVQRMEQRGYRHLPILEDGHVSGITSIRGILQYIHEAHIELE